MTELRTHRGMSQRELAAEVGRSESWVSQVERGVLRVDRVPVLQALADALGVPLRELHPDDAQSRLDEAQAPSDMDALRLVITGHPAPRLLLGRAETTDRGDVDALALQVAEAWTLTHASSFRAANGLLTELLPTLEKALRAAKRSERQKLAHLLADAYQAASSAFARLDEADAAWVAADRAITVAEAAGDALGALSGLFRMAHAFITLRRLDQAEHAAMSGIEALRPTAEVGDASPEELSVYGALHLALSIVHARAGDRAAAREAITKAREIAARIGGDRNDYETEFGPTNVELHAVAVSVELGDAGEALDVAATIDAARMSPERQSRLLIDVARAHAQRRHFGEAVEALLSAEAAAPEQVHSHVLARQLIRDLLAITGRRAPQELVELGRRSATLR